MEDSLEDFIKITRNIKEVRKSSKENKEVRNEVLITLQKKNECEARAVKIVEFLIEGKLRPEVFLRCLKHINQSYYQDVVEERAISKLCGYSLCGKQIPEMPKKQFYINSKINKVYDVTDRKNYCSNFCYKASVHIKQQIDNGPLWIRKLDDNPKFNLLSSTERGLPGEEIDQGIVKPVQDPVFTSVTSFTEMSLSEMDETETKNKNKAQKLPNKFGKKPEIMKTLDESEEIAEIDNETNLDSSNSSAGEIKIKSTASNVDVKSDLPSASNESIVKNTKKDLNEVTLEKNKSEKISFKPSKSKKRTETPQDVLQNIKKFIYEWITLETYVFLYGENKVKEMLNETQFEEYFKTIKAAESTVAQQKKYQDICRKLHLNQLAEDKFDRSVIGIKMKPVPDFTKLKEESKAMNLKVHSFYSGVGYESNKNTENKSIEKEDGIMKDEEDGSQPEVMPQVDTNSQISIRRKVYLNSISKTMANLIPNLGIHSHLVMDDLQALVKTFKLQAHNVVFAPAIRTLIALILIKMLSIRDHNLKAQLETARVDTFIKLMLSHFPNGHKFLSDLFENIADISLFLKEHFKADEV